MRQSAGPRLKVVHTVSSLQGGGMEHFVLRLAEAQQRLGHKVTILALQGGPLLDHAKKMGLNTIVLGGSNRHLRLLRGALTMLRLRPHMVHAHNPTSLHYAVIAKLLNKFVGRSILIMTDHAATRGVVRVPGQKERENTDAVVCVSHDTARRAGDHGITDNLLVIHNGVELKHPTRTRQEVRQELGLAEDAVVGTMVAAFAPVKGHDVLLRALDVLKRRGVKVTVLVVGQGGEKDRMEELARSLKLGDEYVQFLGFRADVPDLQTAADFNTLPSRMEGLPLAVLEAMSFKLPVIVTPVGGVPELVEEGVHGFLVPVDDHEALAEAMEKIAGDPGMRKLMGEAGYKHVVENFTFDEMTRKYEELYAQLCTKHGVTGI